ncbi:type 1 glutamine amidotransferase [Flammeovirga kamogawensis]|uniref:GMP synthase n=1 Tax=Flammeovirga kamogawensis TaxID=373891 RepID=A0ABX8GX92_9BACT|nr:GMP synthase [Flammeovirga kamogawensis]MBB6460804.1 GMP synthase-like glutamine amidotransferase [Flammeovirga kamogawensis]QWG08156.1 GMP synthase [Flammeovirga kamogawensis]TRX69959.1 GMP synthase [Flammeovirga kamogawensis]
MGRLRLALIDMYNKVPNEGMRCIKDILEEVKEEVDYQIFDLRGENQLPDTSFDIYISTGGPGNPLEEEGWEQGYFDLLQKLWEHNLTNSRKKYMFFICHSFQMASRFFGLGQLSQRHSTAFGAMRVHKTEEGKKDPFLSVFGDTFYAIDSRDHQLLNVTQEQLDKIGAKIVCMEKIRPHTDYKRAVMAIRFSDEFFGTQFHPEADAEGLIPYFGVDPQKKGIIEKFGENKFNKLMKILEDPSRLNMAFRPIIPSFLQYAIQALSK